MYIFVTQIVQQTLAIAVKRYLSLRKKWPHVSFALLLYLKGKKHIKIHMFFSLPLKLPFGLQRFSLEIHKLKSRVKRWR